MKITYHITREDYIDAQKLHRLKSPRALVRGFTLLAKVVAVAGLVIALVLAVASRNRKVWSDVAPLIGLWVVWALFLWVWVPFNSRRCYAKDRRLQDEFTAEISEEGVYMESPTFNANLRWGLFLRFLESDRVFLLYQTSRMFNLLPKSAFTPAEIDEFRQLLRRKLPDK